MSNSCHDIVCRSFILVVSSEQSVSYRIYDFVSSSQFEDRMSVLQIRHDFIESFNLSSQKGAVAIVNAQRLKRRRFANLKSSTKVRYFELSSLSRFSRNCFHRKHTKIDHRLLAAAKLKRNQISFKYKTNHLLIKCLIIKQRRCFIQQNFLFVKYCEYIFNVLIFKKCLMTSNTFFYFIIFIT